MAELSAELPRTGGEYAILRAAYGPQAASLSGWAPCLLGFAAAAYLLAPAGLEGRLLGDRVRRAA